MHRSLAAPKRARHGVLVPLVVALSLAVVAEAQPPSFDDRTEVVIVEVPVQVIADGKPVRGLTAENFEISDNGRERQIAALEVVDLLATAPDGDSARRLPVHARRHFLLLFDLSFSDPASIERARRAGRELVAKAFHPTDLTAVAAYTASRGAEILLGFTTDRQQVVRALDTLSIAEPIRHARDPLALTVDAAAEVAGRLAGGPGNHKADRYASMIENYRDMKGFETRSRRELQERDILALASSFEELGKLMRGVPGRKQVVLLSEGFDSSIVIGTEDAERQREIAADAMAGELWRVDSEERFGSNAAKRALDLAIAELQRADCAVQAVDIGGVRGTAERGIGAGGQDGLFILADRTGGELYRNHNEVGTAMAQLIERTGLTYVLSFSPDDLEHDGRFHRLKVKLVDAPRGARVVHRPGYYAPRPYSELGAAERRIQTAGLITGGEPGGRIPLDVLAAPFAAAGDSYVPVLLEIDGPALLAEGGETLRLELYVYAISEGGSVADYFAQSLTLDVDKVRPALAGSGYKFWGHLELPPDRYVLRALVRNAETGSTGLRLHSLEVPAAEGGAPTLLPPFFPEDPGRWLLGQESERPEAAYPFVLDGEPFVPAARPILRAGERVALSLVGYNLEGALTRARAELFTPSGETVARGVVAITAREPIEGPGLSRLAAELSGIAAEPGDYRLVVTMLGADGEPKTSGAIPLHVVR